MKTFLEVQAAAAKTFLEAQAVAVKNSSEPAGTGGMHLIWIREKATRCREMTETQMNEILKNPPREDQGGGGRKIRSGNDNQGPYGKLMRSRYGRWT